MPKVMDLPLDRLTEREKHRAKELLDELSELGPEELPEWNFRANTFLVFAMCRHPFIIFGDLRSGVRCG